MEENSSILRYVKIFLLIVAVAAIISIVHKSFTIYEARSFRNETFNLLYVGEESYLAHLDSANKKIAIVKYPKGYKFQKTRFANSALSGVLVDAQIREGNRASISSDDFINFADLVSLLSSSDKKFLDNLNEFDLIKMYLISKSIPADQKDIYQDILSVSSSGLYDKKVLNEQLSVAVINASEVNGLGAKTATAFKRVGYNVVSTDSSDPVNSEIKTNKSTSVSVEKLNQTLKFPINKSNSNIFDIIVVVGRDALKH